VAVRAEARDVFDCCVLLLIQVNMVAEIKSRLPLLHYIEQFYKI
jgi:hypothetical protein